MQNKKFGALSSSVNTQELSLTITSAVRLIISMLVSTSILTATGGDTILEQTVILVPAGYASYQLCLTIWGAVRKIIVAVSSR